VRSRSKIMMLFCTRYDEQHCRDVQGREITGIKLWPAPLDFRFDDTVIGAANETQAQNMLRDLTMMHANLAQRHGLDVENFISHGDIDKFRQALYTAGVKLEEIVYRLRWSSDAVEFYIRECGVTADYYTLSAVQGALAT